MPDAEAFDTQGSTGFDLWRLYVGLHARSRFVAGSQSSLVIDGDDHHEWVQELRWSCKHTVHGCHYKEH